MHFSTKKIIAAGFIAVLLLPVTTQAANLTADQINSVIGLLQSFNVDAKTISNVQAVLNNAPAPRPEWAQGTSTKVESDDRVPLPPGQVAKKACIMLMRNLSVGSRGDDVRELQKLLKEDRETGFVGSTTGYYGPMTAQAMMRFQMKNGIASTTTGIVGPVTRGFFERRCGYGLGKFPPPAPQTASGTYRTIDDKGGDR